MAYGENQQIAVLIGQRLLGKKMVTGKRCENIDRHQALNKLLAASNGALLKTGLGSPSYDVHAHDDAADNYYLWGAMGGAALTGLGLAQAQPEK